MVPPLVGFSINKFQPTLTMVKYLPAWHLVGDSQPLGMLQTGPPQAKSLPSREGRNAGVGRSLSLEAAFSLQYPQLGLFIFACALECPEEGSHTSCVFLSLAQMGTKLE